MRNKYKLDDRGRERERYRETFCLLRSLLLKNVKISKIHHDKKENKLPTHIEKRERERVILKCIISQYYCIFYLKSVNAKKYINNLGKIIGVLVLFGNSALLGKGKNASKSSQIVSYGPL